MKVKKLKRGFFQRIMGKPATPLPENNDFWSCRDGKITIDLSKTPALDAKSGAIRIEGEIPAKLLVVHGEDGEFHVFENKCSHGARCVDPVPGTQTVQCCSVNTSTYDYQGNVIFGPANAPLTVHPFVVEDGKLVIKLD